VKAFIVSLLIFLLAVSACFVCAAIVTKGANALLHSVDALPDTFDSHFVLSFTSLHELWLDFRPVFSYFVGHTDVDLVESTLSDLYVRYQIGDLAGYASAKAKLLDEFLHIRDSETLSFDNLF